MASAGEFVRELAAKELAVASATEGIGHYDGSRDKLDSHTARRVQQVAPVIVRSQDNDDNAGTASKLQLLAPPVLSDTHTYEPPHSCVTGCSGRGAYAALQRNGESQQPASTKPHQQA